MLGLQYGCLSLAILLRSEARLGQIIKQDPEYIHERNLLGQTPLHLAAVWPADVSALFEGDAKVLLSEPDYEGCLPVTHAVRSKNLTAVWFLVDAGSALCNRVEFLDVPDPVMLEVFWRRTEEIIVYIVQALAKKAVSCRHRFSAVTFHA